MAEALCSCLKESDKHLLIHAIAALRVDFYEGVKKVREAEEGSALTALVEGYKIITDHCDELVARLEATPNCHFKDDKWVP